tara:strand:- start:5673 stop:7388 length:1716 start_codon:yes stop_codon:yes gene_type:complete
MTFKKISFILISLLILSGLYVFWTINYHNVNSISELTKNLLDETNTENSSRLSSLIIPESDLPPEGTRSLFDHIIAQNNGLPFPFNNFIRLLTELHPEQKPPLMLMIPDGRSLLKGQANQHLPRILLAPDFEEENTLAGIGKVTPGQLFLGYVEAANEIEVISYNEAAGRFEFQLIQDYCEGCIPKIVYAKRAICLSCHQGATPIFSQRPWQETNGQLAIAHAIKQARQGDSHYWGAPIQQTLATSERYDELTDIGNFFVASQRVWLDGCGEAGNACRRQLLSLALRYAYQPGQFNSESEQVKTLKTLWANSFPESGILIPESDLRSRDPSGKTHNFTDWLYETFTPDISFGEGAKDNEDLSAFEKLPPLSPSLDPLTIRKPKKILFKEDIDGIFGIARFFSNDDITSLSKSVNYDIEKLSQKVTALPSKVFDALPFSRVKMMRWLLDKPLEYCCLNTSDMSEPYVSGEPELDIVKHIELENFRDYCFTCHRGNPSKRLNFMSGSSELEVLENIQAKVEIRDALDWERYLGTDKASTLMPPSDSIQYKNLQQAGEEAREKMRETVPSMFSF